jgi:integration host factor subunit alpha
MSLGKTHLLDGISSPNGSPKRTASQALESLLKLIKSTLESGEPLMITRFGKFQVKDKRTAVAKTHRRATP